MIPAITASKIYSTLGNNNSLVPLAIKDVANSLGLTAGSYITGDTLEGKDRFIDEFGTQAIWLFGIPAYKKAIDLTLYKILNIDPNVDVRNLKNPEILKKAIEFAPNEKIAESIRNVAENPKFTKNLAISKFAAATILAIGSYTALTKYRHKKTREAAEKEILAEIQRESADNSKTQKTDDTFTYTAPLSGAFEEMSLKSKKQTSFTGALQDFMFNPVKNLMILDGSITAERLADSRNKQELIGYTIKEGTFWAFMYFASKPIQKFLENSAEKKHNKSIDLDARVIESNELKKAFENKIIEDSVNQIKNLKSDVEVYEFINKNPDNFVVKMAKMSDVIPTMKGSNKIDTRKYIDISDVRGVGKKLEKLYKQFNPEKENLDEFLKQVKKLKRSSVLKNMGACVGVLGVLAPAIMVALRKLDKNNKEFQVKEDLKKELAFKGKKVNA